LRWPFLHLTVELDCYRAKADLLRWHAGFILGNNPLLNTSPTHHRHCMWETLRLYYQAFRHPLLRKAFINKNRKKDV